MSTVVEQRAFETAIAKFPIEQTVRGNVAFTAALGPTRKRNMSTLGTVVDYDRVRLRVCVNWSNDRFVEYVAPKYLEAVEK